LARSLNWGILSTARIAVDSVIPAIKQSKNGKVVAIASRTKSKAEGIGRSFGIPSRFASYEGLLNSPEVEAVYIPLPNGLHKEWVIRAAEHGKHILCEKPISTNASDCKEMIDACKSHGVLLMEGFMYRFHPQTIRMRELLDKGVLGRVSLVRSSFTILLSDTADIRYQRSLGGGCLFDVGSYCVNVTNSIIHDDPVEVHAMARLDKEEGVDVVFSGLIRFKDNSSGLFDSSFTSPYRHHLEIVGEEGTLEVPNPFSPRSRPTMLLHSGTTRRIVSPAGNMYRLMVEHFSECVLENREPSFTLRESLRNMQLIDSLLESSRRDQ